MQTQTAPPSRLWVFQDLGSKKDGDAVARLHATRWWSGSPVMALRTAPGTALGAREAVAGRLVHRRTTSTRSSLATSPQRRDTAWSSSDGTHPIALHSSAEVAAAENRIGRDDRWLTAFMRHPEGRGVDVLVRPTGELKRGCPCTCAAWLGGSERLLIAARGGAFWSE